MGYFLGFDGGGTKTDCVLIDASGTIIGEGRGGPANPLRFAGYEGAYASLRAATVATLTAAKIQPRHISGVCAGLAGAGRRAVVRRMLVFLSREFPAALAQVVPDYEVALEAGAGAGLGVVLIAGTGSVAFGRNAAGETARAGGHGPWLGDEGSAFEIGRRAVATVALARDAGEAGGLLPEMILAALECPDWDELTLRIMNNSDDVFPKVFPVVAAAADSGDGAAREIMLTSATGLGNLTTMVIRRLGMQHQQFPLVKCGGVFGQCGLLDSQLDSVLASGAPHADVTMLEISPALGAARMAARLSELPPQAASHGA